MLLIFSSIIRKGGWSIMDDKKEEERLVSLRKGERERAIRWFRQDLRRWKMKFDSMGITGKDMVMRLIPKYKEAQNEMREMFTRLDMCKGCGRCCCYRFGSYMRYSDYVILRLEGIEILKFSMPKEVGKEPKCIFMGKEGCAFPKDLRLETCVTYACDSMYHQLRNKGKRKQFLRLKDNVKSISCAIDDLARIVDMN